MRSWLESRLWQRNREKLSVTPRLTAEFLLIGNFELALVKKVGYGAIAGIKIGCKYHRLYGSTAEGN
ncbi:hypothetical protein [Microcoleus sp. S13C4]|uniref:hypothetical protein n=1 Tax=Microcoleus sp. S13C4 TaxID=3055410 RepID=UPI002FD3D286